MVKDVKARLLDRLVDRGILKREAHRVLWLVPYNRFPELDGSAERDLRQRIHDVVLHGAEADEATALLISLVHACGLVNEVFPDQDAEAVKEKIKVLSEGSQIANAIVEDVASATIAVVCSSVVGSIISTLNTPLR